MERVLDNMTPPPSHADRVATLKAVVQQAGGGRCGIVAESEAGCAVVSLPVIVRYSARKALSSVTARQPQHGTHTARNRKMESKQRCEQESMEFGQPGRTIAAISLTFAYQLFSEAVKKLSTKILQVEHAV